MQDLWVGEKLLWIHIFYAGTHFTKMSAINIKDTIAFMLLTKFHKIKHDLIGLNQYLGW